MINLDNNATTLIDPQVKLAIDLVLSQPLGNPSSAHRLGQRAKGLLNTATQAIASFFHVRPDELIFTSGATEALNMVIRGIQIGRGHIISSLFEHPSVLLPLQEKQKEGFDVTYLKNFRGFISIEDLEAACRPDTRLIILMAVNNETGIKNPIEEIALWAYERNIALIVDGVSLLGKEIFPIPKGVSAMCFSSHKIHGPCGVGLCFVRKGLKMSPLIFGGAQQRGKRSGTENVAGIVGFAKAVDCLKEALPLATFRMEELRNRLEEGVSRYYPEVIIHGKECNRICNVSNMSFANSDGEMLLMKLDLNHIAVSHGSACSSGGLEPSHVLLNMGIHIEVAASSLRFSLSRFTTEEEIDQTIKIIAQILR